MKRRLSRMLTPVDDWRATGIGAFVASSALLLFGAGLYSIGGLGGGARVGALEGTVLSTLVLTGLPITFFHDAYAAWAPLGGLLVTVAALGAGSYVASRRAPRTLHPLAASARVAALVALVCGAASLVLRSHVGGGVRYLIGVGLFLGAGCLAACFVVSRSDLERTPSPFLHVIASTAKVTLRALRLALGLTSLVLCVGVAVLAHRSLLATSEVVDLVSATPGAALGALLWLPNLLADAFLGTMGIPLMWEARLLGSSSGSFFALAVSPLALLIPAIVSITLGFRVAEEVPSWRAAALRAALSFTALSWLLALLGAGQLEIDAFVGYRLDATVWAVLVLPPLWGLAGGTVGALAHRQWALWPRRGNWPLLTTTARAVGLAIALVALASLGFVPGEGERVLAATSQKASQTTAPLTGGGNRAQPLRAPAPARVREDLQRLRRGADGPVDVAKDTLGNVNFVGVRGLDLPSKDQPAERRALAIIERYRGIFGLEDPSAVLGLEDVQSDNGGTRVKFTQSYRGVPVFLGSVKVTLPRSREGSLAISNAAIPDVALPSTTPRVTAESAEAAARRAGLPDAQPAELIVLAAGATEGARLRRGQELVWLTRGETEDYFVDATTGEVTDVVSKVREGLHRRTFRWNGGVPGSSLRVEGQGPVRNSEGNQAHLLGGQVYDYFRGELGRDSWDDDGAPVVSTVEYDGSSSQYRSCPNAVWLGRQMLFCRGLLTLDIVAHEFTHGVTQDEVGLYYTGVGPASSLDEHLSDVFGEMAERNVRGSHDWLIGADLSADLRGGRRAFRNMRDPSDPDTYGGIASARSLSCGTESHRGAGIGNRAFYLTAQSLGERSAERIWYEALRLTSGPYSGYSAFRAATRTAAFNIGDNLTDDVRNYEAVTQAWDSVDVTAGFYDSGCGRRGLCAAGSALETGTPTNLDPNGPPQDEVLATLYRVRNELLPEGALGAEFRAVYDVHSDRISELLLGEPALRAAAGQLLQDLQPGLDALTENTGDQVELTPAIVREVQSFMWELEQSDVRAGGGRLAEVLEAERSIARIDDLQGESFDAAYGSLDRRFAGAEAGSPSQRIR